MPSSTNSQHSSTDPQHSADSQHSSADRQRSLLLRQASPEDLDGVIALYKKVSRVSGGLARGEEEITPAYVGDFMEHARHSGFQFVMVDAPAGTNVDGGYPSGGDPASGNPTDPATIVGELHCYKPGIKCFDHLLSELTIAVDPDFQGRGIGKALFAALFSEVTEKRPDIRRIELLTGESNQKAIAFYQSLGFIIEGRLPDRFILKPGVLDADIPMAWFNPNFGGAQH